MDIAAYVQIGPHSINGECSTYCVLHSIVTVVQNGVSSFFPPFVTLSAAVPLVYEAVWGRIATFLIGKKSVTVFTYNSALVISTVASSLCQQCALLVLSK